MKSETSYGLGRQYQLGDGVKNRLPGPSEKVSRTARAAAVRDLYGMTRREARRAVGLA